MNRAKLCGRIREKYGTQEAFAEVMDMSPATLSAKLRGKSDWTRLEIELAGKRLEIPVAEIPDYFFSD